MVQKSELKQSFSRAKAKKSPAINKISITLGVLSGLVILSGVIIKMKIAVDLGKYADMLSIFLVEFGAILLAIVVADGILLRHTERKIAKITDESTTEITQQLFAYTKQVLSVAGQAIEYGLEDILDPRHTPDKRPNPPVWHRIKEDIANFIAKDDGSAQKIIRLLGISLIDIFVYENALHKYINELVQNQIDHPYKKERARIEIRALLLDPDSDAAGARSLSEGKKEGVNEVKKDIEDSKKMFKALETGYKPSSHVFLEMKQTDFFPPAYFIMTDDFIFIEQYHMGRGKEELQEYKCLGGRLPIFKLSSKSDLYQYMKAHFDFFWSLEAGQLGKYKVEQVVEIGSTEKIELPSTSPRSLE